MKKEPVPTQHMLGRLSLFHLPASFPLSCWYPQLFRPPYIHANVVRHLTYHFTYTGNGKGYLVLLRRRWHGTANATMGCFFGGKYEEVLAIPPDGHEGGLYDRVLQPIVDLSQRRSTTRWRQRSCFNTTVAYTSLLFSISLPNENSVELTSS